jgi:lysylphosphatidylglycerol synthetase-like protein (DUF2156 family)
MTAPFQDRVNTALVAIALAGLLTGLALSLAGLAQPATVAWTAGVLPVLAALVVEIARSLRAGEVGLDIVAALSMTAALAFGETLAAAVVALMYSGGTFLESFAEGRARREMSDLLVPRAPDRDPPPQRRARRGAAGRDRAGRPAADPAGRRGPGGWNACKRSRRSRHFRR